ncbi:GNAT family N-acetyltransferase [Evansella clarkii]|uniref:GNAT family N-acetyltransferase n=1 Tax=Evansella clarkii TaxID=79879 RepID=UPI00099689B7|nr:GNAT family N-acetyltransferase [Evansella clarkii]
MIIKKYISAAEMLARAEDVLTEKEAENNLPLGLLKRLAKEEENKNAREEGESPLLVLVENESEHIEFIMVQTPPQNLVICGNEEAVERAVLWLKENKVDIPGVVGCKPVVEKFANKWKDETECNLQLFMKQKIYKLETLKEFPRKKGRLCYATEDDIALVTYWTQCFYEEALEPKEKLQAEEFIMKEIKCNRIFLWRDENGVPVSMAKRSRESENGVTVSLVYTPDEYKKQGYATTCVAAMSEWLLKEGFKFCSLYTDADNHVSNRVYLKIGYEPIADSVEYRFISGTGQKKAEDSGASI